MFSFRYAFKINIPLSLSTEITRTHTFPHTGIYNGNFVQVLAYTWFYKSEKMYTYAKSSFRACVHF